MKIRTIRITLRDEGFEGKNLNKKTLREMYSSKEKREKDTWPTRRIQRKFIITTIKNNNNKTTFCLSLTHET